MLVSRVLHEAHLAGGLAAVSVARNGHEIERHFDANLADQVGHKNRCALQDADQVNALALIILGNLSSHFAHAFLNRAAAQQDLQMLLPVTLHWESPPPGSGYSSAGNGKAQGGTSDVSSMLSGFQLLGFPRRGNLENTYDLRE